MIKKFLLGLLILISISLIFTQPGVNTLEIFNNLSPVEQYTKYPPGQYFVFKLILNSYPLDQAKLTYTQVSWSLYKLSIYFFFILTLLSILYFAKVNGLNLTKASISYFASGSILLSALALSFPDIYAAPFLILAICFTLKNKFKFTALFYILGLVFNWTLLVLAPVFLIYFLKNSKKFSKLLYLFTLLIVTVVFFGTIFLIKTNLNLFKLTNLLTLPWLINQPFELLRYAKINLFSVSSAVFSFLIVIFFVDKLLRKTLINQKKPFSKITTYFLPVTIFTLPLVGVGSLPYILISFFTAFYLSVIRSVKSLPKIENFNFLLLSFSLYSIFILFIPGVSEGNLIWLVLLSILIFLVKPDDFSKTHLIVTNLVTFIILFFTYGSAGESRILGDYYNFFGLAFSAFFVWFLSWNILGFNLRLATVWMQRFLIFFAVLINLSLIPANGSPDKVSWTQYAIATVENNNPFYAQTIVDQRYPPLATVIQGGAAQIWHYLIGESETYHIATKISIVLFYFLTILLLVKFSSAEKNLTTVNKLLVCLTTFSIIVQTQGLADINVYVLPSLFASIVLLFNKKYLLSGLLLGITISIKWQPMILLPLFLATTFNLATGFYVSMRRSLLFVLGLIPVPIVSWYLVLIYPGGITAFQRSTDYLLHGAPMLSGQALNLNWIVTYIMHLFAINVESLAELDNLNRQIATDIAPLIFQGYFFIFAFLIIFFKFWIFKKKSLFNFLSASLMIFFSHFMLNKSAYEKHLFYTAILMLFIYLIKPSSTNRYLLILFDVMVLVNLGLFYGFTGSKDINRLFFGFDMTVLFSVYYLFIYLFIFWKYFKNGILSDTKPK